MHTGPAARAQAPIPLRHGVSPSSGLGSSVGLGRLLREEAPVFGQGLNEYCVGLTAAPTPTCRAQPWVLRLSHPSQARGCLRAPAILSLVTAEPKEK